MKPSTLLPVRTKPYVAPVNGTFRAIPIQPAARVVKNFAPGQPVTEEQRQVAQLAQQLAQRGE